MVFVTLLKCYWEVCTMSFEKDPTEYLVFVQQSNRVKMNYQVCSCVDTCK